MGGEQYTKIQNSLRYFEQRGLFSNPQGDVKEPVSKLTTVSELIDRNYDSFNQSCLIRAEGDQTKADYLQDCSYFVYYERQYNWNKFQEKQKELMDKNKPK